MAYIEDVMEEYNALDDKEKIRRLEYIAQNYASWLGHERWEESPYLDATSYWHEFQEELDKQSSN